MKRILIALPALAALVFSLAACDKNEIKYGDFDVVGSDKALLKINVVTPYRTNPQMYLAIDSQRVSTPITSRTPYPGGGYNTGGGSSADYMVLAPGKHRFKIAIPNVGKATDSIVLYTTEIDLKAGIAQSLHVCDTSTSTQSFILTDDRTMPDSGFVKYKFVHLMPQEDSLDLYFGTNLMASKIPFKGTFEFTMPIPTSAAWAVRRKGSSANLATYTSANTYLNKRVYTVFASGYSGPGSTDPRRPFLSFYLNF